MPNPDPARVAEVAKGLSPAMRLALAVLVDAGNDPYGRSASDLGISGSVLAALCARGLAMSGRVYGGAITTYRFEQRALAVRAYLKDSQ